MNIRNITLLIVLLSALVTSTWAQTTSNAAATQRAAIMKTLSRGASLSVGKEKYQVLPGAQAAKSLNQEQPQQTLTRAGGDKLIETKGSFVVFTVSPKRSTNVTSTNGATSYATVVNQRTGDIGILPGTICVKLKNMGDAAVVASSHGVDVVREFTHLQVVYYQVKSGQDVLAAAASLTQDSRVKSAEVEVIEHMMVPK